MNSFELFEQKLGAKLNPSGQEVRFDPTIILMILGIIIPLIQQCFFPSAARLRQRRLMRPRLIAAIKREARELTWEEVRQAADACFDVADEATEDECQAFIKECCD